MWFKYKNAVYGEDSMNKWAWQNNSMIEEMANTLKIAKLSIENIICTNLFTWATLMYTLHVSCWKEVWAISSVCNLLFECNENLSYFWIKINLEI